MYLDITHRRLGYSTQTAAIRGLDAAGRDPHAIADTLRVDIKVVRARLWEAKNKAGNGGSKPTNGHPTRTDAVLALVAEGKGNGVIAQELGISVSTVGALIASAKRRKTDGSGPTAKVDSARTGRPVEAVPINEDVKRELRPHAARRDLSVLALAQLIIETVVSGGLVDAVLDDKED